MDAYESRVLVCRRAEEAGMKLSANADNMHWDYDSDESLDMSLSELIAYVISEDYLRDCAAGLQKAYRAFTLISYSFPNGIDDVPAYANCHGLR